MTQIIKKTFLLIIISIFSIPLMSQNYAFKDHLSARVSISYYETYHNNIPNIASWVPFYKLFIGKEINLRAEINYSVLNCLEFGIYGGVQRYYNVQFFDISQIDTINTDSEGYEWKNLYAPVFGINCYFHPLKLFVKNNKSRYDLYLTAKYGGVFFTKWGDNYGVPCYIIDPDNIIIGKLNRYRHEYGIGIGGAVYFWQIIGIYCEVSIGQYSHYPEFFNKLFNVRGGITLKFDAINDF
ncbi:MAG: hypothetical protein LBP67_01145 [Bacteroidales bacterium]|jgi:hypothetical protein|nr:hypothetical protein [Bacteroidales bacterium]